ncbi:hypothetical protein FACS1894141_5680 [Spirochaetia bacterium]|nr:hypothetical protein FACS1894141_5680 [Spirochaetia bacterium]
MNVYRPLRVTLFFYDLLRLIVLLQLWMSFAPLIGDSGFSGDVTAGGFPALVYIAPNGLFPLMALFLWRRLSEYKAYITLYIAGKIISIVVFLGWFISSLQTIALAINEETLLVLGGWLFLTFLDAFSVLGAFLLKNRLNRGHIPPPLAVIAAQNEGL